MKCWFILLHRQALKSLKEASHRRPHILWFYLKYPGQTNHRDRTQISGATVESDFWNSGFLLAMIEMLWYSIVVIIPLMCWYTKNNESYNFKWLKWWLWLVDFPSYKIFMCVRQSYYIALIFLPQTPRDWVTGICHLV